MKEHNFAHENNKSDEMKMQKPLKIDQMTVRNRIMRTESVRNFEKTLGKPVDKADENRMFREYKETNDRFVKEKIVNSHSRFVYSIARSFTNDPDDVLDLTMEGFIGLLTAIDKFDPDAGNTFLSFATHYVYKRMIDYSHKSKIVRRSKDASLQYKVSRVKDKFYAENGRYPDINEIIDIIWEKYGMEVKQQDYVHDIIVSRLDDAFSQTDGDDAPLIDSVMFTQNDYGHHENDVVYMMNNDDNIDKVNKSLSILSPRDRGIMKMLYGIDRMYPYTPEQVADELRMTVARVNQIHKECLKKMKEKTYPLAV